MFDRNTKHITPQKHNLLVVLGPTAGGKTHIAVHLAQRLRSAVISADSRQVYRNMDIGTGKDLHEYAVDGAPVEHFLINIVDAGTKYNVFEYQQDFFKVYPPLIAANKIPVMCGGSGMYIESILKNYRLLSVPINENLRKTLEVKGDDELSQMLAEMKKLHNHSDTDNRKRLLRAIEIETYYQHHQYVDPHYPTIKPFIIGVKHDRQIQRDRISERLKQRLEEGMLKEAEDLLNNGLSLNDLVYYGLEYKFMGLFLHKVISYDEMCIQLNHAIHQFAKRQMTWFRKMEREGFKIHWLESEKNNEEKVEQAWELVCKNF